MCECCRCQSNTTIRELAREHDVVVDLIGDIGRQVGSARVGSASRLRT